MEHTCVCGKQLHRHECGFHSHKYENILLLVCPYCRRTKFLEMLKMQEIPFLKTMAKANDEAIAEITRLRNAFDDYTLKD